jgi:3-carboxy-cis,cis-muconate cycloisomerase
MTYRSSNRALEQKAERIFDPLFASAEISAVFSGKALMTRMLQFEWALAAALEKQGVIPQGVAAAIQAVTVDDLNIDEIAQRTADAGNLAIPFVAALTTCVAKERPELSGYVHYGATSQDVLDTSVVLQFRDALTHIEDELGAICAELVSLVTRYKSTLLPGRTWLQQGPPVTLGLKLAGWLDALQRHRERVQQALARCCVLQFGGAVGTLAALGDSGPNVTREVARGLELPEPAMPWQTHRDRLAEIAATLGMICGTLGKIGRDMSLLMQSEVAEAFEPVAEGRGGSSTMPHKRNPVASSVLLAAAVRAPGLVATMLASMVQEHERGIGGWQAEWETLPELFRLTGGALRAARQVIGGVTVDAEAMLEHLKMHGGVALSEAVSFALAAKIGKARAHRLLEQVTREVGERGISLRDALLSSAEIMEHLSTGEIDSALDPVRYLGSTDVYIAKVLAREGKG